MARQLGAAKHLRRDINVNEEIIDYLKHQPFGARVTRFLIRDFIIECRGLTCEDGELEAAIEAIEVRYGMIFSEGSLSDAIQSTSPQELIVDVLEHAEEGLPNLSKLDELEMNMR